MANTSASTNVKNILVQFVKFGLVGVLNTLISEGGYAVLVYFNMHYIPASFISFSLSVVNAYFWNANFVFNENGEKVKGIRIFGKTYMAYLWGYIVHALLLVFWIEIVKVSAWMTEPAQWFTARGVEGFDAEFLGNILAAALNLIIVSPMNFAINKFWTFRKK